MPSIPYEIIRRNDGAVALSCNAGLLPAAPASLRLGGHACSLLSERGVAMADLVALPEADRQQIVAQRGVHFFEACSGGLLHRGKLAVLQG